MSRLFRILLFTLLIAAIVFFAFRSSQSIEEIEPPVQTETQNTSTTIKDEKPESTAVPAPPQLKDLSKP